jgi:hypothetical protein
MTQPVPLPPQQIANQATLAEEAPADRITKTKTLYDVSLFQIFLRNFVAGLSRALGGIILYLAMVGVATYLFILYAWPQIKPMVGSYQNMLNIFSGSGGVSLDKLPRFDLPSPSPTLAALGPVPGVAEPTQAPIKIDPSTIQEILKQMKK